MFQLGKSEKAFNEAKRYMPGGVNSPVRSYRSVGSNPPFISSASGSRIYDIDNNEYIDYVLSWEMRIRDRCITASQCGPRSF